VQIIENHVGSDALASIVLSLAKEMEEQPGAAESPEDFVVRVVLSEMTQLSKNELLEELLTDYNSKKNK
jgi:hypothetical protein